MKIIKKKNVVSKADFTVSQSVNWLCVVCYYNKREINILSYELTEASNHFAPLINVPIIENKNGKDAQPGCNNI